MLDPICNAYKAVAQQSHLIPGQDVVVFGTGLLGLFSVQVAKLMGAVNIVMVGLEEDVKVRFFVHPNSMATTALILCLKPQALHLPHSRQLKLLQEAVRL